MKKTLSLLATAFVLSSCGTTYYQMFEAEYASPPKETPEITVNYNLWAEGGNMAFTLTNNTDKVMTVHWDKSFFILNGLSIPYYDNVEHTESAGTSVRSSQNRDVVQGSSTSTTRKQERFVMIAPGAGAPFITYAIHEKYLYAAKLEAQPKKRDVPKKEYSGSDSPLKFSNFITYQIEGETQPKTLKHDFYIKSVSNWHASNFAVSEEWSRPGEPAGKKNYYEAAPLRFYVSYFSGGY